MDKLLTMSNIELTWQESIQRIEEKQLKQREVVGKLSISEQSVRRFF